MTPITLSQFITKVKKGSKVIAYIPNNMVQFFPKRIRYELNDGDMAIRFNEGYVQGCQSTVSEYITDNYYYSRGYQVYCIVSNTISQKE